MTMHRSNSGWHSYWRDNRLAACVPDNPDSAAAIQAHWIDLFAELPSGARVLDVATGNGVLLVWAVSSSKGTERELALTGIDSADIDPERFLPEHATALAPVTFLGNTRAEALPFADNSFDLVVSQYGLEYADLELAVREAARVLAPGGQLCWLAHADDSAVVAQGKAQLADMDLLLASDGPFAAMQDYVQARQRGRKVTRATAVLTEALRAAEAHCAAHPPAAVVQQLCAGILDTANRFEAYRPEDVVHWLDENRKRLRGQRQRIRDLQSARLTPARLAQLEKILGAAPWSQATIRPLRVGAANSLVGQWVQACIARPDDASTG